MSLLPSVPAASSDAGKDATLRAAEKAGFFPVKLIEGPEAAALYTTHTCDFAPNIGDAFIVCDAGLATVNLTSYEVDSLTRWPMFKELVPTTGKCAYLTPGKASPR